MPGTSPSSAGHADVRQQARHQVRVVAEGQLGRGETPFVQLPRTRDAVRLGLDLDRQRVQRLRRAPMALAQRSLAAAQGLLVQPDRLLRRTGPKERDAHVVEALDAVLVVGAERLRAQVVGTPQRRQRLVKAADGDPKHAHQAQVHADGRGVATCGVDPQRLLGERPGGIDATAYRHSPSSCAAGPITSGRSRSRARSSARSASSRADPGSPASSRRRASSASETATA